VKFELGSVGVGELLVLAINPPVLTVIPLRLHSRLFFQLMLKTRTNERCLWTLKRKQIYILFIYLFWNSKSFKKEA
jgi:hypothetical protein